jgi:histidine ammonia-lyase
MVLAIEILAAARALDLRAPLRPSPATAAVRDAVRAQGVAAPGPDRYLAPEIDLVADALRGGAILAAAQQAAPAQLA